jgi:hypothetical protein
VSATAASVRAGGVREELEPLLDEAGLGEPLFVRQLPWERWDPTARRLRA